MAHIPHDHLLPQDHVEVIDKGPKSDAPDRPEWERRFGKDGVSRSRMHVSDAMQALDASPERYETVAQPWSQVVAPFTPAQLAWLYAHGVSREDERAVAQPLDEGHHETQHLEAEAEARQKAAAEADERHNKKSWLDQPMSSKPEQV
jgi:hypothetical protein